MSHAAASMNLRGLVAPKANAPRLISISPAVAESIIAAWKQDFRERTKWKPWQRVRWSEFRNFTVKDWGHLVLFAALMGLSNQVAKDQLTAIAVSYNAGTAATITFYGTARATDVDTAVGAQTVGGTCTMSASAWGSPADANPGATITAATITDDSSADNTVTVTWCRVFTQSGGTAISDHNCGTSSSDFVFNTTAFTSGSTISVTSFVITQPES